MFSIWVHHFHTGAPAVRTAWKRQRGAVHAQRWRACCSLPQFSTVAVQTERAIQRYVRMIHPLRRIFLDRLRKRIEPTPSRRLAELTVLRLFELTEDGHNIARIDRADFSGSHDPASCFIVILELLHLHFEFGGLYFNGILLFQSNSKPFSAGLFR